MKNIHVIVCLCLLVLACGSQANSQQSGSGGEEHTSDAVVFFPSTRYHFGEIYHGDRFTHHFPFYNRGTSPLVIDRVRASCGCTTPEYPKHPIMPGDSATIGVTYNSVGKQGTQTANIRVFTNDANQPEVRLHIVGRVLVPPPSEQR